VTGAFAFTDAVGLRHADAGCVICGLLRVLLCCVAVAAGVVGDAERDAEFEKLRAYFAVLVAKSPPPIPVHLAPRRHDSLRGNSRDPKRTLPSLSSGSDASG
jgi:hypothetical protein